jgi:transcription elongation factor GreA
MTRVRYEELEAAQTALETKALFLAPEVASEAIQQAKAELAQVDDQLEQLQALLKRAQVVDPPVDPTDVELGTVVQVRYEDDREETLTVVGPTEGGARLGTVVSASALGTALLKKRPGQKVTADGPDGQSLTVEIVPVEAAKSDAARVVEN